MHVNALRLFIFAGAAALLVGCATTLPNHSQQPAPVPPPISAPAPPKQTAAPPAAPSQQPVPPATAAPPTKNPPAPASKALIQKGQILVTKEEYRKTFDDVHRLIEELNRIIAARDYQAWTKYLTAKYEATYSDPKKLAAISDQPMLKRYNLHLKTLKDYFLDVVVPSRANARLDDLDFVSKTQVKAITIIDGERYILYDLRLVNGDWKIGVS